MNESVRLQLPMGFRMEDRVERLPLQDAERKLLSKKWRYYTNAQRQGEEILLYSRWIRCPHCGESFAANSAMFPEKGQYRPVKERSISKQRVVAWASPQLTLPEFEPEGLALSRPMEAPAVFQCPGCGSSSRKSERCRQVELRLSRKKLELRCEICTLEDLMSLGWHSGGMLLSLPAREVLTFHFGRGRVYVQLEDHHDHPVACRDVTDCPEAMEKCASSCVLNSGKTVRRKVRQFLCKLRGALPFRESELTLPVLTRLTRFQGYDVSFYSGIPYCVGSCMIDRSFAPQVRKLRRADALPALYGSSGLPKVKSLRRCLFEEPALFFYLNEIRSLWELLEDPNLLCRLLAEDQRFEILSMLHQRPGIRQCLVDYGEMFGTVGLCRELEQHWFWLRDCAIDYCSLSTCARAEMRKKWKEHRQKRHYHYCRPALSRPMRRPPEEIQDCKMDGFDFAWLRSSNDYRQAALELNNCLDERSPLDPPVVCVRRYGQAVAAVEVSGNRVLQALGFDNDPLEDEPGLYRAVEKWMVRFHLAWGEDEGGYFEDPEEPDLPF